MTERLRIGDMLVEAGLIQKKQLDDALEGQRKSGRRLGAELVAQGVLDEVQLTQVISNQLSIPWVSLYHVEFSRDLLNLISPEVAETNLIIPIYVRRMRGGKNVLFVAMVDPTNASLLEELAQKIEMPVRAMIAPPSEIKNAIGAYYFGRRPTTVQPSSPPEKDAGKSPPSSAATPPATPGPKKAPPATPAAAEAASSKARQPHEGSKQSQDGDAGSAVTTKGGQSKSPKRSEAVPSKGGAQRGSPSRGAKMITLTLLDGTSVRLPAPGSDTPTQEESLTASDLVAALRARAQGKDVSRVLPDSSWEKLFATLLTLLIRKGLIADWEFAQEWRQGDSANGEDEA